MKKLLLAACLSFSALSFSQEYSRAKIMTGSAGLQQLAELGIEIDHGTIKRETFFVSDFSANELQQIRNAGFQVEILIDDVVKYYTDRNQQQHAPTRNADCEVANGSNAYANPAVPANFNLGTMGGFYTYEEFLAEIDAMSAQFPNLITQKTQISNFTSIEGRPLYYLRMSDNPNTDEAEPEVLYTSNHHAREPNALSETIFYMWYMLENYATNPEIAYLLNNTELYFVPMVNPDGYRYNQVTNPNGGGLWRKNRRQNADGSYGVDLNRNYSYAWNTTGVSQEGNGDTYAGTAPFSEPETQAIKWFCENRDFVYAFNAHTYSNDILYPIGATVEEVAEDNDYFDLFTHHMVEYNGYTAMKSSSLYPASGDSDDYMYKDDLSVKPKIFAMTPEVGSGEDGFWPASANITGICKGMFFPNLVLAHLSHKYLVVKDLDPGAVVSMTGNFNHKATRLGIENGAVAVSITPISGIASVGNAVSHTLNLMANEDGAISYVLNPNIQFGDEVKYVLNTDYGLWTKHDTIVKTFGQMTVQFTDDASTNSNWTGNFATTTSAFVSPSQSFTDSPTGNYAPNANKSYTLTSDINLANAEYAGVSFYAKWDMENEYDFAQFQVSVDGGTSWIAQCGKCTNGGSGSGVQPSGQPLYDGSQTTWVLEEINLSDYIGQTIKMRFVMRADAGVQADGFYFDDFKVMYAMNYTGTEEQMLGDVKIFPNPATSSAVISLPKPVSGATLRVYAVSGQEVYTHTISSPSNTIDISTQNWQPGIYTVVVENAELKFSPAKLTVVR